MKITQQNQSANKYMLCIAFSFKNESVSVYQLHFIVRKGGKFNRFIMYTCLFVYVFNHSFRNNFKISRKVNGT